MSFVERFIILCLYLGESTIRGSTVLACTCVLFSDRGIGHPMNVIESYIA